MILFCGTWLFKNGRIQSSTSKLFNENLENRIQKRRKLLLIYNWNEINLFHLESKLIVFLVKFCKNLKNTISKMYIKTTNIFEKSFIFSRKN